jgi:hypothetical protein
LLLYHLLLDLQLVFLYHLLLLLHHQHHLLNQVGHLYHHHHYYLEKELLEECYHFHRFLLPVKIHHHRIHH